MAEATPPEVAEQAFYERIIASDECACGKMKAKGFAFCYKCHKQIGDRQAQQDVLIYGAHTKTFARAYEWAVIDLKMRGAID